MQFSKPIFLYHVIPRYAIVGAKLYLIDDEHLFEIYLDFIRMELHFSTIVNGNIFNFVFLDIYCAPIISTVVN